MRCDIHHQEPRLGAAPAPGAASLREVTIYVNGEEEHHAVPANQTLLAFLRDTLDLTGAKEGCGEGECGSCVVLVDGRPVNSCLTLTAQADGATVTTIEGLGHGRRLHPMQSAFLDHFAVQCGYCTPGMVMTALGLLVENPDPTEEEVRVALAGNLCRCTGYRQILDAVLAAAAALKAAGVDPRDTLTGARRRRGGAGAVAAAASPKGGAR